LAKQCTYKSWDELPNTLQVKHIENLLGVSRHYSYKVTEEGGLIPRFQGDEGEKILLNKIACQRAIGYQPLELTKELTATPLVWDAERMAQYLGIHIQTFYERMKRKRTEKSGPYLFIGKRILCCREAFLIAVGYAPAPSQQHDGLQPVA
jgi:hypothetical protein